MFSNQSAELSLGVPCKTLSAVRGDKLESRFVVGTCCNPVAPGSRGGGGIGILGEPEPREYDEAMGRDSNHLYLLRFDSQINELGIDAKIVHPTGPVGVVETCPQKENKHLLFTATEQSPVATLWKLPSHVVDTTEDFGGGRYDIHDYDDVDDEDDEDESGVYGYSGSAAINRNHHHPYDSDHNNNNGFRDSSATPATAMEAIVALDSTTGTAAVTDTATSTTSMLSALSNNNSSAIVDIIWRGRGDDDDDDINLTTTVDDYMMNYDDDGEEDNYYSGAGGLGGGGATNRATTAPEGEVLTLDKSGKLIQWDISDGGARVKSIRTIVIHDCNTNKPALSSSLSPPRMAWDPHNSHAVAVTRGNGNVRLLDLRTDTSSAAGGANTTDDDNNDTIDSIRGAHRYDITDLDYNHNKPYILATSGQDGCIKFWDLRYTASTKNNNRNKIDVQQPNKYFGGIATSNKSSGGGGGGSRGGTRPLLLMARGGHDHWITNIKYNPFHDQLLLSTGTDSVVNLWRVSTISSSPLLLTGGGNGGGGGDHSNHGGESSNNVVAVHNEENNENNNNGNNNNHSDTSAPNVRVTKHEHSDSVYAGAWSAADAWVYSTVSCDGKVALHHVPSKEKYKILL